MKTHQQMIESVNRSGATAAASEHSIFEELNVTIDHFDRSPLALIQILHRAQELFGYLRDDMVHFISLQLRIPLQ